MKKWTKKTLAFALTLALVLSCTMGVGAAETEENRLYDIQAEDGYTLTLLDADNHAVTAVQEDVAGAQKDVYKNVAKLMLEFAGDSSEQYVVFLLSGGYTVPTQNSIRYIDQKPGAAAMEFILYPDQLTQPGVYTIHVSNSQGYAQVGSVTVAEASYTLGDVNGDGDVSVGDALMLLQYLVETETLNSAQKSAADVNKDESVNIGDVVQLLQYLAGSATLG